jgi:hypothetical protein
MASFEVRFTEPAQIEEVARLVKQGDVVFVALAAQMTRYPLIIGKDNAFTHVGMDKSYGGGDRIGVYYYVALMEFGGCYCFQPPIHWGYLKEKLKLKHDGDASNIATFLNALTHPAGVRAYLAEVPFMCNGDHPDHERTR